VDLEQNRDAATVAASNGAALSCIDRIPSLWQEGLRLRPKSVDCSELHGDLSSEMGFGTY
jgi:hypothetical protein